MYTLVHACTTLGHIITHFWPMMTSVVMVLNLFLNLLHSWCEALFCTMCFPSLLQICILPVPRRQPRPGDSVMGRKVAFQCDVDILMMVHAAWEQPCFPSILPRYLMAIIFTAFDLAAYIYIYKLKWLVNEMHTHLHCQYVQTLFSIAPCSIVLGPAAFYVILRLPLRLHVLCMMVC